MYPFSKFFAAVLAICFAAFQTDAAPSVPAKRSFRPVVPIKQNVRGGLDQMKRQSVTLKIPPPPISASSAHSEPTATMALDPGAEPISNAPELSLPPEPREKPEEEQIPKIAALTEKKVADDKVPTSTKTTKPSPEKTDAKKTKGPTLEKLRNAAHDLAGQKLTYVFGADDPDSGGLDCSSTIQYLLNKIGVDDVPRTSYDQYAWLKRNKLLDDVYGKTASTKLLKKLSPGDLIFWGGTWKSGHRVSHVMLYMGYDPATEKHYVFGARGKSVKGLTGSGVDIFELNTESGRLIAHGKIPGLIY